GAASREFRRDAAQDYGGRAGPRLRRCAREFRREADGADDRNPAIRVSAAAPDRRSPRALRWRALRDIRLHGEPRHYAVESTYAPSGVRFRAIDDADATRRDRNCAFRWRDEYHAGADSPDGVAQPASAGRESRRGAAGMENSLRAHPPLAR